MNRRSQPAKILIVDDHPLVREGLTLRISMHDDLQVCGEAESEDEALALVKQTQPDLAIVDLSLKSGHGLEVVKQVKSHYPKVAMLVLSGFQESLYAERALRAGALGYLCKHESNDKLLDAIRTVLAGERYMSAELARKLVARSLDHAEPTQEAIGILSDRELEVFRLIGEGCTSGAIAGRLSLSVHTIDSHRENIKRKLRLKNAGELTRAAVQWVLEGG